MNFGRGARILSKAGGYAAALGIFCATVAATSSPSLAAASGKSFGFVMSNFDMQMTLANPTSCPQGYAVGAMELFLKNLVDKERDFWSRPEQVERLHFLVSKGPHNEDLCKMPTLIDDPGFRTVQGHGAAPGLNLDGSGGSETPPPGTCAHEKFVGANGEPGIDNQLFRVFGCIAGYQPGQQYQSSYINDMQVGEHTYLIEITGTDDLYHNGDVQVGIYVSPDVPPLAGVAENDALDSGVRLMHNASIDMDMDPRFQNIAHGRIVDGVLTTDPIDLRLPMKPIKPISAGTQAPKQQNAAPPAEAEPPASGSAHPDEIAAADRARANALMELIQSGKPPDRVFPRLPTRQPVYEIHRARLRLAIKADGTLSGVLAGYYDLETLYANEATSLSAAAFDYDCPGIYGAMRRLADGDSDPKTGHCTSLSSAFKIDAVPAFLVRPEEAEADEALSAKSSKVAAAPASSGAIGGWVRRQFGW